MIELALFEPDIPQNSAACMRLVACFETVLHIIEPCGFLFDARKIRRIGMDYVEHAQVIRYTHWEDFLCKNDKRVILATTKASIPYQNFSFEKKDIILMGRESSGVPSYVHQYVDKCVKIPMSSRARSLNMAMSAGILLSEALRQTEQFMQ